MGEMRSRLWLPLSIGVAAVLTGFSGLAVLGAAAAIFAPRPGNAGLAANLTIAVIGVLVAAACVRWAVYAEHRLHSRTIAARTGPAGRGRPLAHCHRDGYRPRLHHHRQGPVAATIGAVIFTLAVAVMTAGTIHSYQAWRLSRYVQSHGETVPATVVSVRNIEHSSKSGTWYTADISVALGAPTNGVTATTVYDPQGSQLLAGDPLIVMVDPQRPGYAELPGQPFASMAGWLWGTVVTPFFLLVMAVYWRELAVRFREHRRLTRVTAVIPTSL